MTPKCPPISGRPLLAATALATALWTTGAQAEPAPPPPPPADHSAHQMAMPDWQKPMTRADMEAMVKAHFAEADANKDGFVTQEEMKAMRDRHMQAMMGEMFTRMDANGDGQISRAEFDAHHAAHMQAGKDAHAGHGNMMPPPPPPPGGMGPEGMKMMHGNMGDKDGMGPLGAAAFAKADSNKDGKLSLAEVQAAQAERFAKLDANKDGVVTADERKAMFKARRAAHRAARK